MFWPPRPAFKLPPTNATSDKPQIAESSPIVSIKMIGGVPPHVRGTGHVNWLRLTTVSLFCFSQRATSSNRSACRGNQNQSQAPMLSARRVVRRQHRGFLAFHCATGDEDQVRRSQAEKLAEVASLQIVPIAFKAVVLHRAGDADSMTRNTQLDEPPRVFRILRGHDVNSAESRLQRPRASFDSRDNSGCSSVH